MEERPELTDWNERIRQAESTWIEENLAAFQALASAEFEEAGRGIVLIETQAISDEGRKAYGYLTQSEVEAEEDEELIRRVGEYDPRSELLIVLKKGDRTYSIHQVPISPPEELPAS